MRLSATDRLEMMGRIVAIAEDRALTGPAEGVSLAELADLLGSTVDVVQECLEPISRLDPMSGGFWMGPCIETTDSGHVVVRDGWWREMAVPTPGQAAHLVVQAAAAAALGGEVAECLTNTMRKLRRLVSEVFVSESAPPPMVLQLRDCVSRRKRILVNMEKPNETIDETMLCYDPLGVFRVGTEWRVTLRPVSTADSTGPANHVIVAVHRIFSIMETGDVFEAGEHTEGPSTVPMGSPLDVTLQLPATRRWMLDPFNLVAEQAIPGDRVVARLQIEGRGDLRTLLLQLGPEARLVAPTDLRQTQQEAAISVLALYE